MAKPIPLSKRIAYFLEAAIMLKFFVFSRLLPLDAASALGGWLGRNIGPHLKWHRVAKHNLLHAFPEKNEQEREEILRQMWDSLGRNFAEMPWLGTKALSERIQMDEGTAAILDAHKAQTSPLIYFGGHFGNWELNSWFGAVRGVKLTLIYRRLNNPYGEYICRKLRQRSGAELYPKGKAGARAIVKTLQQNGKAGVLLDQKQNDGKILRFLGHPSATTTIPAELGLKYHARFSSIRCIRLNGCHFRALVEDINTPPEGHDAPTITQAFNDRMEEWIREIPAQWLWVHQRWEKIGN